MAEATEDPRAPVEAHVPAHVPAAEDEPPPLGRAGRIRRLGAPVSGAVRRARLVLRSVRESVHRMRRQLRAALLRKR